MGGWGGFTATWPLRWHDSHPSPTHLYTLGAANRVRYEKCDEERR
jgi:hypothetical protein